MALFKQLRGSRASLDAQPLVDGYAYFCVDDGTFHIDFKDENGVLQRKQINAKDAETLNNYTVDDFLLKSGDAIAGNLNIDGKLVIGDGEASGTGAIAGGTTDDSIIADLAGDLASYLVDLEPAKASGALSIAYGANSETIAPGSASIGVINTAGVNGYYWDKLEFSELSNQISIQLSTTRRTSSVLKPSYPTSVDWAVGDILCIKNGSWYNGYLVISSISGNTIWAALAPDITTSTFPFTESKYTSKLTIFSYDQPDDRSVYALQPVDTTQTENKLKAPYVPRPGVVSIGFGAIALGGKNTSTGMLGIVKGRSNLNTGTYSDVSGKDNTVHANSSSVSGTSNTVYGKEQLVSGDNNTVDGKNSIVSGQENKLGSSNNNIVIGEENTVGNYVADSYVNGYQSNIEDNAAVSFIHGLGCRTKKYLTTAFGAFTKATKYGQFAVGRGNNPDEKSGNSKDAIFMVGGVAPASASDISEPTTQNNAFSVFWDGTARVGADPVAAKDVATKGYVDNKTKDMATKTELSNYATTKNLVTKDYVDSTFTTKDEISTFLNDFIALQKDFLGIVDSGTTGDCTWTLYDTGTLIISGNGAMLNYTSSNKAPWGTNITDVIIEDSVTSIGNYAFKDCTSLTSITIPNSVTSIGKDAFCKCESVKDITIPYGITIIKESTFESCKNLTSLIIPNSVTTIEMNAFRYCSNLTNLTLSNNITKLPAQMLWGCTSLTSIAIPNSVTSIGSYVFYVCSSLESVSIPNSVTSIDEGAFKDCTSLTSITIPDSVTSIGQDAFYNTGYHKNSDNWENDVLYIGNHLIKANISLSGSYEIKAGIVTISDNAFYYCTSLTSITIPDSVTSIGKDAFYNCTNLKTVYYRGSEEDMAKISIGSNNDSLTNINWVCNYVG